MTLTDSKEVRGAEIDEFKRARMPIGESIPTRSIPIRPKASGREWYIEACHGREGIGLRPTTIEPSVFTLDEEKPHTRPIYRRYDNPKCSSKVCLARDRCN